MNKCSIVEVGPRDGLQNQSHVLSLAQRETLVRKLLESGLREIEVGSFVREDKIPQLVGTAKLVAALQKYKKTKTKESPFFWAFVPNVKGMEFALNSAIDGVGLFVASSESFCQKNVNRSQTELLSEIEKILPMAKRAKIKTRVYLSTITYCPYEGNILPNKTNALIKKVLDLGVDEISLGDTTGHATPQDINKLLTLVLKTAPSKKITMHLHDTRGLAMANVWESLKHGIARFDSSVGGLGGCPYAPGAAGNLATEDLIYAFSKMNLLKNKVSLDALASTSYWLEKQIKTELPSKVLKTLNAQQR